MVTLNGYDIELTRGDTLLLRIDLSGRSMPDGTDAVFTLKKNIHSTEAIIQKRFGASDGSVSILLAPRETNLKPGVYYWDLRLQIPQAEGGYEVLTPMEYAAFAVLDVVGDQIGTPEDPGVNPDLPMVQEMIAEIRLAIREAEEAAARAEKAVDAKAPRIGENHNWWLWNSEAGMYVDSGVCAVGNLESLDHVDAETLRGKTPDDFLAADACAADAKKLDGKEPKYYLRPHNLLDNSDFVHPVNQRGFTVYNTNGSTIDRWVLYFGDWAYFELENGLKFNASSAGCSFFQRIPKDAVITGARYTLAYQLDGTTQVQELVFEETENDTYDVAFIIPGGTHTVLWAALYEGEYTVDNLPAYESKGYAAELAECQRYYVQHDFTEGLFVGRVYGTDAYKADVTIPIAGNLRLKAPTMVNELTAQQCFIGTEMHTGMVTANYINVSSGCVSLTFHSDTALIPASMCVVRLMGKISFSADL